MALRADDETNLRKRTDERAEDTSGKGSWDRTVASVPSSGGRDPKDHEPNTDDMSSRKGDFGPGHRRPR